MKLELSDGTRSLDLLSGDSIYAVQEGFDLPVPGRDVTYINPVDVDGQRRIRTKDTNGEGRIAAMISGTSDANFWDNIDNLLELVQSAHRNRGSITYTPPNGSNEITWDLEAITVTGLPQKGQQLSIRRAECEISFETKPYGRLAGTIINLGGNETAEQTLNGPVDYVSVSGIAGQIQAFAELKLTDVSSQNRRHVEIGVQEVFDSTDPEPILLTAGTMANAGGTIQGLAGLAGTAGVPTGAYTTSSSVPYAIKCSVGNRPLAVLTTGEQPHHGKWKIRARVYANDPAIRLRLAWRVGSGQLTKEQWRTILNRNQWIDLDLGTVEIPKLQSNHNWEARIEAIGQVGYPQIFVDHLVLIPADRYLQVRGLEVLENASPILAGDDFQSHAAGSIDGKTPPITAGGNWSSSGAGSSYFVTQRQTNVLTRAGTGDSTALAGRFAQLGTVSFSDVELTGELFPYPSIGGTFIDYPGNTSGTLGDFSKGQTGVIVRYQSTNSYVKAFYTRNQYRRQVETVRSFNTRYLSPGTPARNLVAAQQGTVDGQDLVWIDEANPKIISDFSYLSLHLQKVVGGTVTALGRVDYGPIGDSSTPVIGGARQIRVIAGTAGDIEVWEGPQGQDLTKQISYPGDAQLATGGTLDSGQIGFYHANVTSAPDASVFYSVTAQDPSPETSLQPAINAGNAIEVNQSGAYTLSGTAGDRAISPIREGNYLQLEPATRNQNESRIVVKVRRGDSELGQSDEGLADQVEARLQVTPRVTLK